MRRLSPIQRGFSLIELMISMTLGLMLVAVVLGIFYSSNKSYTQDDQFARIQENGRFALKFLNEDLSMVGFWGTMPDPSDIGNLLVSGSTPTDCGIVMNSDGPVVVLDDTTSPNTTFSCISDADFEPQTDVLLIKRTDNLPRTTLDPTADADKIFLISNGSVGSLRQFDGTNGPVTGEQAWEFITRVYYIKRKALPDGTTLPTLHRRTFSGASLTMVDEELIEGVENLQVQFGIDTTGDHKANQYVDNPTAAQLAQAVTARVNVLMRSNAIDRDYEDQKQYDLGEGLYEPHDTGGLGLSPNVYRRVYSSTVMLRNVVNLSALAG